MESIYLKTFMEVVTTGSFTRAADNLCITQSAVSRRVKFMEEQYDCQLLDRSGAVLIPTAQGRMVLEKATLILEIEKELLSGLKQTQTRKGLTFACTPTFGATHLPKIQKNFTLIQTDVTDLNFVLENPEGILQGLKDGKLEIAVVEHCQDYDLGEFETIGLPDDEIVLAASPLLKLEQGQLDIDRFLQHNLYGRNDGCCSRKLLEKNLEKIGRTIDQFHRILAFDDLHTILHALLNGDGVSFISRELIQAHIDDGTLRPFFFPGFVHTRKRTLIFSDNLPACGFGNLFIDQILDHFALSGSTRT